MGICVLGKLASRGVGNLFKSIETINIRRNQKRTRRVYGGLSGGGGGVGDDEDWAGPRGRQVEGVEDERGRSGRRRRRQRRRRGAGRCGREREAIISSVAVCVCVCVDYLAKYRIFII